MLQKIRRENKFVLVPALRDSSSASFQELFSSLLREHGLTKMIPQKAGGTPKEYRKLKEIRDSVVTTIKPYIDEALIPQIEKNFGFKAQHPLCLKFDVDVQDVGEWILENLRLGFQLTDGENSALALSEAGTGIQSAVLLALRRLEQKATENPGVQFILAIEEPEAFLHPQRQKELYSDILKAASSNVKVLITTHSPYIVAQTPFARLGLVRKDELYSTLHIAELKDSKEGEIFDAYSDEVNSSLFFAERVVFVEGESDLRVLRILLERELGPRAHRISIISASGNRNFSPFLRMVKAWSTAKIPHLVVTDFDSLTKSTERAILAGAKAAGYALAGEAVFHAKVDSALDKDESVYQQVAEDADRYLSSAGLNVFVFTCDLEHALITAENKAKAALVLNEVATNGNDYRTGYDLNMLRKAIGSKGIPLGTSNDPPFKKPFIHKKIAATIDLNNCHPDLARLMAAIRSL